MRIKTRYCNNPPASNGGLDCELSFESGRGKNESQSEGCNSQGCPGMLIVFIDLKEKFGNFQFD